MERSSEHLRVWYWPRAGGAPAGVAEGAASLDTRNFVRCHQTDWLIYAH